ncbi:MAG: hypothetical protein WCJ09_07730 [Planctomycetota bacterium]
MKQLERLLFLQGNRCFFCQSAIPAGQASVEHLVATANGGSGSDDNCVVCCKSMNEALGKLPIKVKMQVILNQRGRMVCPCSPANCDSSLAVTSPPVVCECVEPYEFIEPDDFIDGDEFVEPVELAIPLQSTVLNRKPDSRDVKQQTRIETVVKHLKKDPRTRPNKLKGLKNWTNSLFRMQLSQRDLDLIVEALQQSGIVSVVDGKLQYSFA